MEPRKVLHVLGPASRKGMAQARILAALRASLDPERYHLTACFVGEPGPLVDFLAEAAIPARSLPFRGATHLNGAARMAAALRSEPPDIVHLHVGGRARMALLRRLSSAPLVAHIHTRYAEGGEPLHLNRFATAADAVVVTSHAMADAIKVPATVVPPAVPALDAPLPAGGPPVIGAVGRLEPVKSLPTLLRAVARLGFPHDSLRVELAGGGSCEPRLRALAQELDIGDQVSLLGWRDDVTALHRRWRILVQPSRHEGFGMAALEAMGSGLPVVATSAGGLPEVVLDGRTGFLIEVGDEAALAQRIAELLRDEALRGRMGNAGWKRAREEFNPGEMGRRMERVYDDLLAR